MTKIVSRKELSIHQQHEFLLSLEKAGLTSALAQKVIESLDNRQAIQIVDYS